MNREAAHMRFSYGPNVMGRLLVRRTSRWKSDPRYIIVDDGSSINDVRILDNYFLIRVERSRAERVYPFTIPNPHMVIHNDGTMAQLELQVLKVYTRLTEHSNV